MKLIKEMHANNIYMIKGESSANAVFFENEKEARLFLNLVDLYLKDYVEVNRFQNTKDGWILVITLKSEEEIREAYRKRREASKKCKAECAFDEIWRIISDQIRILLSTYVRTTNSRNNREGGKVKSSYKRYYFEHLEEAVGVMKKMDEQEIEQSQPNKRYEGAEELFEMTESEVKESIYFGCKWFKSGFRLRELGMKCLRLLDFLGDVLLDRIEKTLTAYKTSNNP